VNCWRRFARRRRVRAVLFGWRAYQLADLVGRYPRYALVTNHWIVARHLIEKRRKLEAIRAHKSEAIEAQEWEKASALRDAERELVKAIEAGIAGGTAT
jgi:hypothetical protein